MSNSPSLATVKTLWIGDSLSQIEQLSLNSYLAYGHPVELFTYQPVKNIPKGVRVRDANEIIPQTQIFYFTMKNGKSKSVAPFSDWFRYQLLYQEGGIWSDTDVICVKPLALKQRLFFGKQESTRHNQYAIGVLGCSAGEPLFKFMAEQAADPNKILPFDNQATKRTKWVRKYLQGNKRGNINWGEAGPIGFTRAVEHFKLSRFALPIPAFYPIHWSCWDSFFDETYPDIERYFPDTLGFHLWHKMLSGSALYSKTQAFPEKSLFEQLKKRINLALKTIEAVKAL